MASANRLLIADDGREFADSLAKVARSCGYVASIATRYSDFVAKLASFDPDVVLLDQSMPGKDATRYLKAMSDVGCTARVMVIGNSDDRAFLTTSCLGEILGLDIVESLCRPFPMRKFRAVLQRLAGVDESLTGKELEAAIRAGQIKPKFRPTAVIRSEGGFGVSAFEAKLSWHRDDSVVARQSEILSAAETHNLMGTLIDDQAQQIATWLVARSKHGRDFNASISLTLSVMLDTALPDRIASICRKACLRNSRLTFRVSEDLILDLSAEMLETLSRLHVRGFRLAIDKFGSGYSSLEQLYRMPFDQLIIDSSIIRTCEAKPGGHSVVEAAVILGHHFGLDVGADGVESLEMFDYLKKLGCDFLQGRFVGSAVPASEFLKMVDEWQQKSAASGHSTAPPLIQPQL